MKALFAATAVAATLAGALLVPSAAQADDDRRGWGHRGWDGHRHGYEHRGHGKHWHKHKHGRYYGPPAHVYYPPPRVYYPAPVVVAPPPPPVVVYPRPYGAPQVSIGFGFHF